MTLDKAREILAVQADIGRPGSLNNYNGTKNILEENTASKRLINLSMNLILTNYLI